MLIFLNHGMGKTTAARVFSNVIDADSLDPGQRVLMIPRAKQQARFHVLVPTTDCGATPDLFVTQDPSVLQERLSARDIGSANIRLMCFEDLRARKQPCIIAPRTWYAEDVLLWLEKLGLLQLERRSVG